MLRECLVEILDFYLIWVFYLRVEGLVVGIDEF